MNCNILDGLRFGIFLLWMMFLPRYKYLLRMIASQSVRRCIGISVLSEQKRHYVSLTNPSFSKWYQNLKCLVRKSVNSLSLFFPRVSIILVLCRFGFPRIVSDCLNPGCFLCFLLFLNGGFHLSSTHT